MENKPDPLGPTEFEETAYNINSSLMLMMGVYDLLPELVHGPIEYKER